MSISQNLPDGVTPEQLDVLRAEAKEQLRQRFAALRRTLPKERRTEHAAAMSARLSAHPAFTAARVVLAYAALRFEIDPDPLVQAAFRAGKTVCLPRVLPETRSLVLHAYAPGDALRESGHVIREPLETAPVVPPGEVDLVLVPGLAFDGRGQRLGFGQGYYDRALPTLSRAVRVGLCFELSLIPEVPSAAHDAPVHYIATERRVLTADGEAPAGFPRVPPTR